MRTHPILLLVCLLLLPTLALAQVEAAGRIDPPSAPTRFVKMDYGPFFTTSLVRKLDNKKTEIVAYKALIIRLGDNAGLCFDTDRLAIASFWTGGFVDLQGSMLAHHKGTGNVSIDGAEQFRTTDPRKGNPGPLPRDQAHYTGLHISGNRVVLSYTLRGTPILETQSLSPAGVLLRSLRVDPSKNPTEIILKDKTGDVPQLLNPGSATIISTDAHYVLNLPARDKPAHLGVSYGLTAEPSLEDPAALKDTAAPRYSQTLTTKGRLGANTAAYTVDHLTLPENNPWTSWLRTTGFDFLPDGRIALCTFNGDVWLVSGVNDKLDNLTWKRYATGLYEPLGLKVVNGTIYVRGRDQITRLHDTNNDGEADYYHNFNNDGPVNPSYHGFVYELETDSKGDFYYTRTGHRAEPGLMHHGCVLKLSKDGQRTEVIATGLRAPNGLGITPDDRIMVSDNQGNWVPSSKIHFVNPGDFLGYTPQHHRSAAPTEYPNPFLWMPITLDSSSGTPAWITSSAWGPLKDHIAHTSFSKAALILILPQKVGDTWQGASVRFPLNFDTGLMRARSSPHDGQLYVCGVGGGWQAGGVRDGGLYRVRYTGKPVLLPTDFQVVKGGLRITFDVPLGKETATDPDSYGISQWNYKWSEAYGSPEFSVADPKKKEHDDVEIESVELSADQRSVLLRIPTLQPVMQMMISINIETAAGDEIETEIYNTINALP